MRSGTYTGTVIHLDLSQVPGVTIASTLKSINVDYSTVRKSMQSMNMQLSLNCASM